MGGRPFKASRRLRLPDHRSRHGWRSSRVLSTMAHWIPHREVCSIMLGRWHAFVWPWGAWDSRSRRGRHGRSSPHNRVALSCRPSTYPRGAHAGAQDTPIESMSASSAAHGVAICGRGALLRGSRRHGRTLPRPCTPSARHNDHHDVRAVHGVTPQLGTSGSTGHSFYAAGGPLYGDVSAPVSRPQGPTSVPWVLGRPCNRVWPCSSQSPKSHHCQGRGMASPQWRKHPASHHLLSEDQDRSASPWDARRALESLSVSEDCGVRHEELPAVNSGA